MKLVKWWILFGLDNYKVKIPASKHSGDNRTGAGEGDDEQISVDLSRVLVKSLVLPLIVLQAKLFPKSQCLCRLINAANNQKLRVITYLAKATFCTNYGEIVA